MSPPVALKAAAVEPAALAVPVARPYAPPAEMVLPYLRQIDSGRWYSNFGPVLTGFERRLAERFARPTSVVTVSSGTQALTLALTAMGVRKGGLCLMPAWTFVATAHAAMQAGLTPWLLDVDEDSWALTPELARRALARAPGPVSAAIVVAPFGRPVESAGWADFREETGIPVLIDAAAGFDTATDARVPTMVSLHATKALGVGEGGFLASEDERLVPAVRELTTYGFRGSRESQAVATNAKLSEYAAAVGQAALDAWPSTRLRYGLVAQWLRIALSGCPDVGFQPGWGTAWVSSVCVARLPDGSAERIEARLRRGGVDSRRWWGGGCHASPAFADLPREALPVTERLARSTLGLPYAMDMDRRRIGWVVDALIEAVRAG